MSQQLRHWAEIGDQWEAINGFLSHVATEYGLQLDFAAANPNTPLELKVLIDEYLGVNRKLLDQERRALLASLQEMREDNRHGRVPEPAG